MDKFRKINAPGIFLGALLGLGIGIAMDSLAVGVGIAIIFSIVFGSNGDEQNGDD